MSDCEVGGKERSWVEDTERLTDYFDVGDAIKIEYQPLRGESRSRTGTVSELSDNGYTRKLIVDVRGYKHSWRVGRSITVMREGTRRGKWNEDLGRVKRVRSLHTGSDRGDPLTLYPRLWCQGCQEYVYVTWPRGWAEREFHFECECKNLSLASLEHGAGWRSDQPDDWVRATFAENDHGEIVPVGTRSDHDD